MKLLATFITLLLFSQQLFAQAGKTRTNIFGDLEFTSQDGKYDAKLKKDIFNALVFSDNQGNEIKFEKKYIDVYFKGDPDEKSLKSRLFRRLIRENYGERDYKASFEVDILGTEIVKENRNSERTSNIRNNRDHGNEGDNRSANISIRRNDQGLEYKNDGESASLEKDNSGKWWYNDSKRNEVQFNEESWRKLLDKFSSDTEVLRYLVDLYLY
ncbi:hypothetical protein GCM10022216_01420 [Sphingobacterium kyonggiense]|uniref:Uncharacterized protein n=1 Tax=Sphingobacterium kyonggiense TaxID=714075 RepID=A0ABP7Y8N4_9SPHI